MRHWWIDAVERRGMMRLRWIESRKRNYKTQGKDRKKNDETDKLSFFKVYCIFA